MTNGEAINWIINLSADIGKVEHRALWHYEQALDEIREVLELAQPEIIRCKDCKWCKELYDSFDGTPYWMCKNWDAETDTDGFCYEAERRTDDYQ